MQTLAFRAPSQMYYLTLSYFEAFRHYMFIVYFRNPLVTCNSPSIPTLDLSLWKEERRGFLLSSFENNQLKGIPSGTINSASNGQLRQSKLRGASNDVSPNNSPFAAFDVNTIFEERGDKRLRRRKPAFDLSVAYYG